MFILDVDLEEKLRVNSDFKRMVEEESVAVEWTHNCVCRNKYGCHISGIFSDKVNGKMMKDFSYKNVMTLLVEMWHQSVCVCVCVSNHQLYSGH